MLYGAHTYNEKQTLSDRVASRNENRTLVNLLQERALQQPDQTAYTFLEDGERESNKLT